MAPRAHVYRFADIRVDATAARVFRGERPVALEPKAFDVLKFLLENRGRLVEKQELLDAVWGDLVVTENAMTRVVAQLRKSLGDNAREALYIETVPTRGYRFIADAAAFTKASNSLASPGSMWNSGCHCTPRQKRWRADSMPSITPSGAVASTITPAGTLLAAW